MENHDCHVRTYQHLLDGFVMKSCLFYPNTWRLAGNYCPRLARRLLGKKD